MKCVSGNYRCLKNSDLSHPAHTVLGTLGSVCGGWGLCPGGRDGVLLVKCHFLPEQFSSRAAGEERIAVIQPETKTDKKGSSVFLLF